MPSRVNKKKKKEEQTECGIQSAESNVYLVNKKNFCVKYVNNGLFRLWIYLETGNGFFFLVLNGVQDFNIFLHFLYCHFQYIHLFVKPHIP